MTESCDKNTRYRLWAQLKEALNGKNMERLARTVRRLFERVIICRHSLQKAEDEVRIIESSGVKVIEQLDGRSFRYPKDRYLTNAEIHTQLMLLEKRFKEQTEVLRNHERKGQFTDFCFYFLFSLSFLLLSPLSFLSFW